MSSSSLLSPPAPANPSARPSFFRNLSSSSSTNGLTQEIFGRRDKPRLYLALYTRGGSNHGSSYSSSMTCESYHWTLLVGPQAPSREEPGTCYQIVHAGPSSAPNLPYSTSYYEETDLSHQSEAQSQALLARIALAKVADEDRLRKLLRALPPSTPPQSNHSNHSDSGYDTDEISASCTCLGWVKKAYKVLTTDTKCLRGYIGPEDWIEVEEVARMYMRRKRRQGRFGDPGRSEAYRTWNINEIPTWNFWENREITD